MEVSQPLKQNPLGLNIDFLFGRGFLWAKQARLSDWIVLESLRMEIPDLQFPFDARGGVSRFRNTRCLVREIELGISEAGLQELIARAASQIEGFQELRVRLNEGAAHVSLKLSAFGADSYVSFRLALIPPEPARSDEVHLSIYDYRAFGPLPYPARVLATELLTSLLNTPTLRPPGRGDAFTVGVAGDILSFHPIKLLLLYLFPKHGWKLPNLAGVLLDGARIRPGQLSLRATSRGERWHEPRENMPGGFQIMGTLEGARAVAAYEAKDLFSSVDNVLFEGALERALEQLAALRDIYGPHPELVARTLDCLLADPSPAHLAEASAICQDLLEEDPEDLQALLAMPAISRHEQRPTLEVIAHYDRLATSLRQRHDLDDWILCELSIVNLLFERDPEQAAQRLREILKISPRNLDALERLLSLYERVGEWTGYEEVLKRLTGVYSDRNSLKKTYLSLAHHLLDRRHEPAEARLYLEKVLRLDPSNLEALDTLGQGYVVAAEPLRALKAFSSAARAAQAHQNLARAAALHHRVARLWWHELKNPAEALLSIRRALQLDAQRPPTATSPEEQFATLTYLEDAATLSELRERWDEALEHRTALIELLERALETPVAADDEPAHQRLATLRDRTAQAHRAIADLYTRRARQDAAMPHWRRVLELEPQDEQAAQRQEEQLRAMGRPEQLIAFYKELLERATSRPRQVEIHLKLAELYQTLRMIEAASDQLREALRLDPASARARERIIDLLRGSGRFETLHDVLTSLLIRLQDRDARHTTLVVLGQLQLVELKRERQAVRSFFEALDLDPTAAVALRGARDGLERLIALEGRDIPAPVGAESTARLLERVLARLVDLTPEAVERAHLLDQIATLATARGATGEATEASRRAETLRVDANRRGERGGSAVDTRLDALLAPDTPEPPRPRLDLSASLPRQQPDTAEASEPAPEGREEIEGFRAKMQNLLKKPASLDRLSEGQQGGSLQRLLERSRRATPPGALAAVARPPLQDERPSLQALLARVDAARASGEEGELVEHLETLLSRHLDEGDPLTLETQRVADLSFELGELLFYELEENARALPHLERARQLDPEGAGERTGLLNALESIYEEQGDVDRRVTLLEGRLQKADSEDLATTYRLLLAQLHWDERRDEVAARALLQKILERDPRNEAVHRLLAQMAAELQNWAEAARHHEVVLSERSGGLDEVELERELADIYLRHLSQPDRAQRHYEGVLKAAPADAQALEGIKQCQAARLDWSGYIDSLAHELGLLLGHPGERKLSIAHPERLVLPEQVPTMLRSAASQILADAAQIAEVELEELTFAHLLWRRAYELWMENAEALERRIALDRKLAKYEELVDDLEAWSDLLLDIHARFEVLFEAALLCRDQLHDLERARQLLAEAIAMVEEESAPPEALALARRELQALGG